MALLLTFFSFTLLFFAVRVYGKVRTSSVLTDAPVLFLGALIVAGVNILYWVSDYFTGNGINNATLYHIRYGFSGTSLRQHAFLVWVVIAAVAALLAGVWWAVSRQKNTENYKERKITHLVAVLLSMSAAILISPAATDMYRLVSGLQRSVQTPSTGEGSFSYFYKTPRLEQTGNKKNLVFIYAEGLEQTYSNQSVFPGLTMKLDNLAEKSILFHDIDQVYGTNYTIAGFVASQCGIPLVGPAYGNSMSGMDRYLPRAVCLGDLLKEQGYHLAYYGGARLDFAGKGLFLKTHGFDEMYGAQELIRHLDDPTYRNEWGLHDDSMLDLAYKKFLELSREPNPFALFTLTIGTHQPIVSQSKACEALEYQKGADAELNAVICSDLLISRFVQKILDSPYAADTVLVVASDHLSPRNPVKGKAPDLERSNRLMIIPPSLTMPQRIERSGSTLDISPTILPFIGFSGDIGLGRNLLGVDDSRANEDMRIIRSSVKGWSDELVQFWDFPRIRAAMNVDVEEKKVDIDGRSFKIPVLIQFDDNLQTDLKFQFDLEFDTSEKKKERSLVSLVQKLDENEPFMLIHYCKETEKIAKAQGGDRICLLTRKSGEYQVEVLERVRSFSVEEIGRMVKIDEKQ